MSNPIHNPPIVLLNDIQLYNAVMNGVFGQLNSAKDEPTFDAYEDDANANVLFVTDWLKWFSRVKHELLTERGLTVVGNGYYHSLCGR